MHPNSLALTVASVTVLPGDMILIGGETFTVQDMVTLPHRAKRLRFETGETLTMNYRTRLTAFRPKARW